MGIDDFMEEMDIARSVVLYSLYKAFVSRGTNTNRLNSGNSISLKSECLQISYLKNSFISSNSTSTIFLSRLTTYCYKNTVKNM